MESVATVVEQQAGHDTLAKVFDVSDDSWLGGTNNIRFMTRGRKASMAVCVRKDGSLIGMKGATKALRRAEEVGKLVTSEADQEAAKLIEIGRDILLSDAVNKRNDAVYRGLKIGDRFIVVDLKGVDKEWRTCIKKDPMFPTRNKSTTFYSHREASDPDNQVSSYFRRPEAILLTEEAAAQWRAQLALKAAASGLSWDDYCAGQSAINNQALRLARALGERATASPFDIETREARVTFGRYTVRMIAEWDDMMTVRVERDGQVVSERGELVSVTMAHAPSASWLSGGFLYNEICGAGYEELLRAMGKLGKGQ